MARSTKASLEAKALAMDVKSEGMRLLYDNGYTVSQVAELFGGRQVYAFAYGVAKRHGVAQTAATRRAPSASVATPVKGRGKAAARQTATAKATRANARERKAAAPARASTARNRVTTPAKPGRPSAARREANRKPRQSAKA